MEGQSKKRKLDDGSTGVDGSEGLTGGEGAVGIHEVKELMSLWTADQVQTVLAELASQYPLVLQRIHEENEKDPKRRKLFVRNMSYDTTEAKLRETFEPFGKIVEAAIIMNKSTNKSKGYGFVTFEDAASADRAIRSNIIDIDGRSVFVSLAAKRQGDGTAVTGSAGGAGGFDMKGMQPQFDASNGSSTDTALTKLFVRQLAYTTTSEALTQFFKQYGPVREAVVLQDKNTGSSKGYGFVTFADAASAQRALVEQTKIIDGRTVHIKLAAGPSDRPTNAQSSGMAGGMGGMAGFAGMPPMMAQQMGHLMMGGLPSANPYAGNPAMQIPPQFLAWQQQQQQ